MVWSGPAGAAIEGSLQQGWLTNILEGHWVNLNLVDPAFTYHSQVTRLAIGAQYPIQWDIGESTHLSLTPSCQWVGQMYRDDLFLIPDKSLVQAGDTDGSDSFITLGLRVANQFKAMDTFAEVDYHHAQTPSLTIRNITITSPDAVDEWLGISGGIGFHLGESLSANTTLHYHQDQASSVGSDLSCSYNLNQALSISAHMGLQHNDSDHQTYSGSLGINYTW